MDIGKDTIDFDSNFDDSRKEPVVLPSRYPNLLVNGSSGIAVGMATNIPPHNLGEVCDAIDALVDNPRHRPGRADELYQRPRFPDRRHHHGQKRHPQRLRHRPRQADRSGQGGNRGGTPRAAARLSSPRSPIWVNKTRIIEGIAELVKDKRIDGISYIRDESDRDGMRIVFEVKRDASPQIVLNQLYHYSLLQDTFGVIMLALVTGSRRSSPSRRCSRSISTSRGRSSPAGPNTT